MSCHFFIEFVSKLQGEICETFHLVDTANDTFLILCSSWLFYCALSGLCVRAVVVRRALPCADMLCPLRGVSEMCRSVTNSLKVAKWLRSFNSP